MLNIGTNDTESESHTNTNINIYGIKNLNEHKFSVIQSEGIVGHYVNIQEIFLSSFVLAKQTKLGLERRETQPCTPTR